MLKVKLTNIRRKYPLQHPQYGLQHTSNILWGLELHSCHWGLGFPVICSFFYLLLLIFPFHFLFFQFYILHKQFFKNEILSAITNEPNWSTKLWFWKWPFYNTKQYFIIRICYHFIVRLCLISSWFSTTGLFDFY